MGAGVGAVACIDNEPSPRRAAIEKTQTELRREVAVRDERRRELEFLERGGNPLDFKFKETPIGFWSASPTGRAAEQLLPSDGKSSHQLSNLANGDFVDKNLEHGLHFKRTWDIGGKACFDESDAATNSSESTPADTLPKSISTSIEHDQGGRSKNGFDSCKGIRAGLKGQYARRNRQKGNRFSNGYAASKDPGKNGVEDSSQNCSSGVRALLQSDVEARSVAKERETQVSEGQNGLHLGNTALVSGIKQDVVSVVSSDNLIKLDATMAVSEPSVLQIAHKADITGRVEWNEDGQNKERLPPTSVCRDGKERDFLTVETTGNLPVNSPIVQDKASQQGSNGDKGSVRADAEKVNVKTSNGGLTKVGNSSNVDGEDRYPLNVAQNVEKGLVNQKEILESCAHQDTSGTHTTSHSLEAHGSDINTAPVRVSNSTLEPIRECDTGQGKVETVGPSCMMIKSSNDRLIHKAQGFGEVKVKLEEGISDQTPGPLIWVNASDGKPMGISGSREASILQTQYCEVVGAGATVDGAVCLQGKDVGKSLASSNELYSQEKKDPIAVTKHKANLSAASRKAHEDIIIEEAETIKASLKHNAEWAKRKAFPEPPRRKSHWDFVLEEMSWLANDFMQERLWKTAAAAQVARWIAKEKRQLEFRETELHNRQSKIARNVANAVTKYWYSIEALLHKDLARAGSTLMPNSSNNKLDGGAVPMEIDVAAPCEVHKMDVEKTKMKEKKNLPIQEYAVRFLKNSVGCSLLTQAEAPPTPDRVSEVGVFDFWEDQFPEESLFYTVPNGAMEVYRQSVESQWEIFQAEHEQRLLEHEAALAEADGQAAAEGMEDSVGLTDFGQAIFPNEARSLTDAVGVLLSPHITGKRTSGMSGPNNINSGGIPTKKQRTSTTRQRAAGVAGPGHGLMTCSAGHLVRSDISSGETNSQQDDMANLPEGSSISGRATDAESSGAFGRNMLADGVDSPFRSKKKKKIKHFSGGVSTAACDVGGSGFSSGKIVDFEQNWQPNLHRVGEQREQQKQKGEQLSQIGMSSPGSDGHAATAAASHLAAGNTFSANKFIKQISNRERGRKYKAGKAPLSQPGMGIPWSPVEDQAILGLVYDLGLNWELVSDILSSSSQLKGIFRKAKDCKERYKMLTERQAGDGGDSPEDSSSSTPHPYISGNQKGGTRFLPQHLEETLKSHMECILQLHQQHCGRKLQTDSQEHKQLVSEHASHVVKQSGLTGGTLTPLELCEQSSTSGDLAPHAYPIQPAHGNGLGIPGMLASGSGMRLASSGVPFLHGVNNLQLSPGMTSTAAINAAATRDAQRMAASLRPLTAEEQRLRYNRMVAGRGLQTQALSVTSGMPLMGLPSPTDCAVPMLSSGNSVGMMCGLSIGMPLSRTGLPGMSSPGVHNISSGMNNILPSAGVGLPGSGAITTGGVPGSMNMMGRPRETIPMVRSGQQKLIQEFQAQGHAQAAAALNNLNSGLSNAAVSSPSQNFMAQQQQQQQQLQQHNHLYQQQQNPGTNQQQAYNMMFAKERQKLQNPQQKRMQQQQFPTSNNLQSSLQASQSHPISQQHQPSHLLPQQNTLPVSQPQQQPGPQMQPVVLPSTPTNMQQSGQSPSALPSLNTNIQSPQQQQALSQTQPVTATQLPIQSKQPHQNQLARQQQQQQGKNSKGLGRGAAPIQNISAAQGQSNMIPGQLPAHLAGQQMPHSLQGQRVFQAPIQSGQHLVNVPQTAMGGKTNQLQASVQSLEINLSQVPAAVAQQQRGFSHHHPGKQLPQQQLPPISTSSATSFVQPASPTSGSSASQQTQLSISPQQQPSSQQQQQQRRAGQQSQTQQCRSQRQAGSNVGMQLPPQPGKNGLQPSVAPPPQLSGQPGHMAFQLGSNVNNPLSMASPPAGIPLSSPISTSTGGIPSSHWKPAQNFSPMAAGIYNLSRSNSAAAAHAHLALSAGMPAVTSNGNTSVASSSLLTHGISAGGLQQQQVTEHAGGAHSQKASVGPNPNARAASQQIAPSQRQQSQQQQHGIVQSPQMTNSVGAAQVRAPAAASSGMAPTPASAMAGGSPSRANLALQTNMPSQPVSGSVLLYNGVQHRQTHQPGVVVTQGLPAPVTTSTPPVPAAGSVPSGMAGTSSVSAVPKSPH